MGPLSDSCVQLVLSHPQVSGAAFDPLKSTI